MRTESDCVLCCLATILGLDYTDVPDLVEEHPTQWQSLLCLWLASRGLDVVRVQATGDGELLHTPTHGRALWIASGPAARGRNHAVVYRGPDMIHDPHPSGAGLEAVTAATVILPML